MSLLTWLAVALGAAIGAPTRYLVERRMTAAMAATSAAASPWMRQPWGLLTVNIAGSAIAGVVLATTTGDLRMLLTVGLCGSLTTFSGFGWSAHTAWSADRPAFWTGLVLMVGGCLGAFCATFWGVTALSG